MRDLDRVDVVCNEESHEGRTCKIATYTRHLEIVDGSWTRTPPYREGVGFAESWREPDAENYKTFLSPDDDVIPQEELAPSHYPERRRLRLRDNLMCKLCGLKVSTKSPALNPVLADFHKAGVTSIELRWLARILT